MTKNLNKLVIFDAYAIIYRAYHALPSSLTTRAGEPINAVYGLISMLIKVLEDLDPQYLVFAWDHPGKNFRNELAESYQANRPKADDELISQFSKARQVIKAMNIISFEKEGFEADDLIGTIANSLQTTEDRSLSAVDVVIVTGDRDMLQLVDNKVKLYMPGKSLSDAKEFGKQETIDRMGVPPELIIDFKALVGDPSDNYHGVPGVGPKTAIDLLTEYKTLENIYKNIEKIKESTRKKLIDGKDSAFLSQKLATIVTDININFDLEKAKEWNLSSEKLLRLFDEYGFKSLRKRVIDFGKEKEASKQGSLF